MGGPGTEAVRDALASRVRGVCVAALRSGSSFVRLRGRKDDG